MVLPLQGHYLSLIVHATDMEELVREEPALLAWLGYH